MTQKIPAIVTLPLDPATMETVAKQAQQQCIPVVTYGNPLKTQDASIWGRQVDTYRMPRGNPTSGYRSHQA